MKDRTNEICWRGRRRKKGEHTRTQSVHAWWRRWVRKLNDERRHFSCSAKVFLRPSHKRAFLVVCSSFMRRKKTKIELLFPSYQAYHLQQSRFTFSFYCLLPPSRDSSKWETIVLGPRPPHVPQFNGWIEERRNKSKPDKRSPFSCELISHFSELLCLPLCKKKDTEWFLEVLTAADGQFEACLLTFCRLPHSSSSSTNWRMSQ